MSRTQETTSGEEIYSAPLNCQYCHLDTSGNHQQNCPGNRGYVEMSNKVTFHITQKDFGIIPTGHCRSPIQV